MNPLHTWKVTVEEAIQIQEALKTRLILKKTFSKIKTIGGADVAYSKSENLLFGAIVVLSFPDMEILATATCAGKIPFPYIPTLLSFREGPILIKTFQKLKIKPDVIIYDGQGIAHPREWVWPRIWEYGSTSRLSAVPRPLCWTNLFLQDLPGEVLNGFEGKGKM
jgi:deoxyribonuclease V